MSYRNGTAYRNAVTYGPPSVRKRQVLREVWEIPGWADDPVAVSQCIEEPICGCGEMTIPDPTIPDGKCSPDYPPDNPQGPDCDTITMSTPIDCENPPQWFLELLVDNFERLCTDERKEPPDSVPVDVQGNVIVPTMSCSEFLWCLDWLIANGPPDPADCDNPEELAYYTSCCRAWNRVKMLWCQHGTTFRLWRCAFGADLSAFLDFLRFDPSGEFVTALLPAGSRLVRRECIEEELDRECEPCPEE